MRENEMREILFRGKRKDNGEWIYGMLISFPAGKSFILSKETLLRCKYCDIDIVSCVILPETRGEYTGLTDKNGVKIFEGDIVRYGDTIHKVVFEQRCGTAYFGLVYSDMETLPFGHYQDLRQIEVLGNIHDNPEMLEGDEEG